MIEPIEMCNFLKRERERVHLSEEVGNMTKPNTIKTNYYLILFSCLNISD